MRVLFAFENALPSTEADAEVFITTARYLTPLVSQSWLHVPTLDPGATTALVGLPVVRAFAPMHPAALRHFCCGLTLVFRKEFRQADLIYTRNLWIAWMAILFGQRVAFDHYRPWPSQIPPLQALIYRLMSKRSFLVNICHSEYTRNEYSKIGVATDKLHCVRNGFEPQRLQHFITVPAAKEEIGISQDQATIVYTGRLNHKKGLDLVIEAAKRLPNLMFVLVGSHGEGSIETLASSVGNIRIVPWQSSEKIGQYIFAADVLLIPPSSKPLAQFGSTVLPLKLFLYMASGRPILAGDTADVREVLRHEENAFLCRPDCLESLVSGLTELIRNKEFAARLAANALADSRELTWGARAERIHDILVCRLQSSTEARSQWNRKQSRTWIRQSWRWMAHLVRTRSWILPPCVEASVGSRQSNERS